MDLETALRLFRSEKAASLGQPAFCVFTNAECDGLVAACPRSTAELARVKGFGKAKVAKFGADIVRICSAGHHRPEPRSSSIATSSASARPPAPSGSKPDKRKLPGNFTLAGGTSAPTRESTEIPPAPKVAPIPRSALNPEQLAASERVLSGRNTFLTGAAGVGKSYVLRYMIQELEVRHPAGVAVTASTGIAASHIGGLTVHSWAGIGLGKGSPQALVNKVLSNHAAVQRWIRAKVLVIDEVSMLDSGLLDALDMVGRMARNAPALPFGGLLLVACGDFFQLPPVSLGIGAARFAFEANAWAEARVETIELRTVVRQHGDDAFISLLGPVRLGHCSAATSAALAACHVDSKPLPTDGITPTKLYCKNVNVDEENGRQLEGLAGAPVSLVAIDTFKGDYDRDTCARLLELVEKKAVGKLLLKVG
jgi:hypothetical protein